MSDLPIILLPGMAANERLFKAQVAAFPHLRIRNWTPARRAESLQEYAERIAPEIDPRCPCLVGGASFGGVVALELACRLPALGCILIGSIRSPDGLPWHWRVLRPIAAFGPDRLALLAGLALRGGRPVLKPQVARRLAKLSSPEAAFVRWATCALLRWRPSPAAHQVRVFQIHGEADQVFPASKSHADRIVVGGAHALPLFSPTEVNEFIAAAVAAVNPA